jgi:hypothetical protein
MNIYDDEEDISAEDLPDLNTMHGSPMLGGGKHGYRGGKKEQDMLQRSLLDGSSTRGEAKGGMGHGKLLALVTLFSSLLLPFVCPFAMSRPPALRSSPTLSAADLLLLFGGGWTRQ